MSELRDRYLDPIDRTALATLREEARRATSVARFYEENLGPLRHGERWFMLPRDAPSPDVVEVRPGSKHPVSRLPIDLRAACSVLACSEAMVAAERAGIAFARVLSQALNRGVPCPEIVWRLTSWGAGPGGVLPQIDGLRDALPAAVAYSGPSVKDWVARVIGLRDTWATQRAEAGLPPLDLLGPFEALWNTGVGLQSLSSGYLVLTLNEAAVWNGARSANTAPPRNAGALPVDAAAIDAAASAPDAEPVSIELVDRLLDDDPDAWAVFGDGLAERGDPRGEAIALELAGQLEAARALLEADPAGWAGRVAALHPQLERMVQSTTRTPLFWHRGFVRKIVVPRGLDWTEGVQRLLDHPEGSLVRSLSASAPSADPLAEGLTSTSLQRVRLLLSRPCMAFSLVGLPRLRRLQLQGPDLQGLVLVSPTLEHLEIAMPPSSHPLRGRLFDTLRTPALRSLQITTPTGMHALPSLPGRLDLRALVLSPVSATLFHWVRTKRWFATLERLALQGMAEADVPVLVEHAAELRHLELEVTVVGATEASRQALRQALVASGIRAVVPRYTR